MEQQQNQPLGLLWVKKSKEGNTFLTGVLKTASGIDVEIVVFKNSNKKNEKSPDYYIWKSKPKEQQQSKPARNFQQQPQGNQEPSTTPNPYPQQSSTTATFPLGNLEEGVDIEL